MEAAGAGLNVKEYLEVEGVGAVPAEGQAITGTTGGRMWREQRLER